MRHAYLKEYRPAIYSTLLLTEKLFPHLAEIDAACKNRLDIIETAMMRQEGVTEALKAADQMEWVRRMNPAPHRDRGRRRAQYRTGKPRQGKSLRCHDLYLQRGDAGVRPDARRLGGGPAAGGRLPGRGGRRHLLPLQIR